MGQQPCPLPAGGELLIAPELRLYPASTSALSKGLGMKSSAPTAAR